MCHVADSPKASPSSSCPCSPKYEGIITAMICSQPPIPSPSTLNHRYSSVHGRYRHILSSLSPLHPSTIHLCVSCLPCASGRDFAAEEKTNEANSDNKDDGKHDDDTSLLLGPVLTLGDGREGLAGDQGSVDSRHFGGVCKDKSCRVHCQPCFRYFMRWTLTSNMPRLDKKTQGPETRPSHGTSNWPRRPRFQACQRVASERGMPD